MCEGIGLAISNEEKSKSEEVITIYGDLFFVLVMNYFSTVKMQWENLGMGSLEVEEQKIIAGYTHFCPVREQEFLSSSRIFLAEESN